MYQLGDQVVYGIHGVCTVTKVEKQMVDRKFITFLVLEPIGQEGTRYLIPAENETAMKKIHPVLTREQLDVLIHSEQIRSGIWNRDENARKQSYRELICSDDRVSIMRALWVLYRQKKEQELAGKKLHQADENFLRDAEKLLAGEIGVIMNLQADQAKAYLRKQLHDQ